jgi:hypothetical protein
MTTKHPIARMSLVSTNSAGTTVTAPGVAPTIITLAYNTMAGNQPSTYANTVYIWQNDGAIPYNQTPLASKPVPTNTQSGSMNFDNLQVQTLAYIIGYATGNNVTNICSWVSIPAGIPGTNSTFQTMITVPTITSDAIVVNYDTPVGNTPQTNGQWIGIWQGLAPYYNVPPLAKAAVTSNSANSQVSLPVQLLRGTSYAVGYFMGAKQTTLAASYNFST